MTVKADFIKVFSNLSDRVTKLQAVKSYLSSLQKIKTTNRKINLLINKTQNKEK